MRDHKIRIGDNCPQGSETAWQGFSPAQFPVSSVPRATQQHDSQDASMIRAGSSQTSSVQTVHRTHVLHKRTSLCFHVLRGSFDVNKARKKKTIFF